jgi:hypothetical protein
MKLVLAAVALTILLTTSSNVQAAAGGSKTRSAAEARQQPTVEGWRYKWHNGHWWYYQPNKQWLFWNGTSWSPYAPGLYRAFLRWRQLGGGNEGVIVRRDPGFSESGEIYQNRD